MSRLIQLKITLQGTEPPVWRRVVVDEATTFRQLHYIIQAVMGWEASHMYQFVINGATIAEIDAEFDAEMGVKRLVADLAPLNEFVAVFPTSFIYEYDFGDGWIHEIVAEKKVNRKTGLMYPVCTDGAMNCPPENCGGIPGFHEFLEIISDIMSPERREMLQWIGGSYNVEYFNLKKTNKFLSSIPKLLKQAGIAW